MAPQKPKDRKSPAEKADEQAAKQLKSLHAAEYDELKRTNLEKQKGAPGAQGND